jgi:CRISPR-associated endonuclease Cas1 subtype II
MVKLDDEDNVEAKAARLYWSELFNGFIRIQKGADDLRNSSLNYTYAILRGAVIRSITNVGLMPSFGIHHQNYFNAFNLADDLIEPFRAFAELHIKSILRKYGNEKRLNPFLKSKYIELLNLEFVDIDNQISSVRVAIDILCKSFQKVILENDISLLKLPKVNFSRYECL